MDFLDKIVSTSDDATQLEIAIDYAQKIYPDLAGEDFIIPEQGMQKFVLLTENEVVCIAREQGVSDLMQDEAKILGELDGKLSSTKIPTVIDFQADNHIMRISRLSGEALTPEKLAILTPEKQSDIAKRIGVFIAEMHTALPQGGEIKMPWRELALSNLSILFANESDPENKQRKLAAEDYINDNKKIQDDSVMLHSDLHPDSILYDETTDTLGVIDFTGAKAGYRHKF